MSRSSCLVVIGLMLCLTAVVSNAQSRSTSSQVKTFEVLAVDGNNLVVRLPEGTREINVPPGFVFTVDGRSLSVGELRPGMSGTATITTTTTVTPVTVTEIKNGTVALVSGTAVYVRTAEGVKLFTQPELNKRGVRLFVDGQPRQVNELHQGDRLSATIVTTRPPSIVTEREVQATLAKAAPAAAPPPAPAPRAAAAAPAPRAVAAPAPAPAPAPQPEATTARALPHTASSLPAIGLAGVMFLAVGLFASRRRRLAR